jgi:hypothetical protein
METASRLSMPARQVGVQPSLAGLSSLLTITQDYVLGYFQTSLRD